MTKEKIVLYDLTGDKIREIDVFYSASIPRIGDSIKINGKQFRVVDIHWQYETELKDWRLVEVYVRYVFEKAKP